jgi:hypothetical protein
MNNPMAITNSFTAFLSANPRRNPPNKSSSYGCRYRSKKVYSQVLITQSCNTIKYLSGNGFTVLTMSDLEYDEGNSVLKIKSSINQG